MHALRSRRPTRLFYGWWIVIVGSVQLAMSTATFFYGFSAFVPSLVEEFGWTRASIAFAASLSSLEGGLVAPLMGWLVDRLGPRRMGLIGVFIFGLGQVLLSQIDSLLFLYVAYITTAVGFSAGMTTPFFTAISNWFITKRGRALGIMQGTNAAIAATLVPVEVYLIATAGWRNAFLINGIFVWTVGFLFALVLRHRPEQYGYLPDGRDPLDAPSPAVGTRSALPKTPIEEVNFTAKEAVRTRAFWLIAVSGMLGSPSLQAVAFHQFSYLINIRFDAQTAGLVLSLYLYSSILGRVGGGWLADKWDKRMVLAAFYALTGIGTLALAVSQEFWHLMFFVLPFGVGFGGGIVARPALQGEYFGRKAFGTISGVMSAVTTAGTISGPLAVGYIFDVTGSYRLAFALVAVLALVGAAAVFTVSRPALPARLAEEALKA